MTKICVIGLGRIGLSLALLLAKADHRVIGVDVNSGTLRRIRNSHKEWADTDTEGALLKQFFGTRFFVTDDLQDALSKSEAIFIAIGTGIGLDGTPDLSNLSGLFEKICEKPGNIRGRLFVLKSTLPVGTTRKIVSLVEDKTGLQCGRDFFAAFCPERVLGDKAVSEMASLPKVIGGLDSVSSKKTADIYATIGGKLLIVDGPETAELIKLMDNAYRQTLFAFANDLALLAELHGMNAYELISKANDSYPRNNIPLPSAGVSGYCLTKDPLYLESSFKSIAMKRGFSSVWYSARKTNDYMPVHMVDLVKQELASTGKQLSDSNILICGIAYKENTDDTRFSHGLEIADRLKREKANVFAWDPHVHGRGFKLQIVDNPDEVLETLDVLVFTVKHDEFVRLSDGDTIVRMVSKMRTPIVIDGWGIFQKLIGSKDIRYAGPGLTSKI